MRDPSRIWLILPLWLWLAVDVSLTLAGQKPEYWAGDYGMALEANPLAYPILTGGPWLFAAMAAAWGILLVVLIACFSHPLVRWAAVIIALSHAFGGCTWLARYGSCGWVLTIAYLWIVSKVSFWCWRKSLNLQVSNTGQF